MNVIFLYKGFNEPTIHSSQIFQYTEFLAKLSYKVLIVQLKPSLFSKIIVRPSLSGNSSINYLTLPSFSTKLPFYWLFDSLLLLLYSFWLPHRNFIVHSRSTTRAASCFLIHYLLDLKILWMLKPRRKILDA